MGSSWDHEVEIAGWEGPWKWREQHRSRSSGQSEWGIDRWDREDTWLGLRRREGRTGDKAGQTVSMRRFPEVTVPRKSVMSQILCQVPFTNIAF